MINLDIKKIEESKNEEFKKLLSSVNLHGNEKGEIFVSEYDIYLILFGADYFMADFYHHLSENFKKAAGGILYNIGIEVGKEIVKTLKMGNDYEKKIGRVLGFLKFIGYSDISFISQNKIIVKSSPDAIEFKKKYNEKTKVCYYLAGIFSGVLSNLLEKNIDVEETKCIANGDEFCEFEIMFR